MKSRAVVRFEHLRDVLEPPEPPASSPAAFGVQQIRYRLCRVPHAAKVLHPPDYYSRAG